MSRREAEGSNLVHDLIVKSIRWKPILINDM